VSISSGSKINIDLNTIETLKLKLNAPYASVSINLRTLHDHSIINCHSIDITLLEDFKQASIYDLKNSKFLVTNDAVPTLYLISDHISIAKMSQFDVLRQ
jgi:hypothetical protein